MIKNTIESLQNNRIIREFVETEAYKQIAADVVRLDPSRVCTEKAARLLVQSPYNHNILEAWKRYVAAGYAGILMVQAEIKVK